MSELEEKLSALMSNPQLMQQIASMAQNMSQSNAEPPPPDEPQPSFPAMDPQQIQAIVQAFGHAGVDRNQQTLLQALSPYLSSSRIRKLERAMRAAHLAGSASAFLNSGALQMLTGR